MARKIQITRTIRTHSVTVLCMDTVKCEPLNETVVLSGKYKNNEAYLKAIKDRFATEKPDVSPVKVVDVTEADTKYAMSEDKFIANAEIIPEKAQVASTDAATTATVTA